MKRVLFAVLMPIILLIPLCAQEVVRLGFIPGFSAVPFVHLMASADGGYTFTSYKAPSDVYRALRDGEIHAAIVPSSSAQKMLDASSGRLFVPCITRNTDFSVVSSEAEIRDFSTLLGKKVCVVPGSLAESFFRFLLQQGDVPVRQGDSGVELVYEKNPALIATGLLNGTFSAAVLGEPALSALLSESKKMRDAIDLQDEYSKVVGAGRTVPLTVVVALTQFRDEEPNAYQTFLSALEASIQQIQANPALAAELSKSTDVQFSSKSAVSAIKRANFSYIPQKRPFSLRFSTR